MISGSRATNMGGFCDILHPLVYSRELRSRSCVALPRLSSFEIEKNIYYHGGASVRDLKPDLH